MHLADGFGGLDQRGQVRAVGLVDRGGHSDDEYVAGPEVLRFGGIVKLRGGGKFGRLDFARAVATGLEFVDARLLDVEADHGQALAEFDGEWQADVAEADDGDSGGAWWSHW
jgi:hypothetical protein